MATEPFEIWQDKSGSVRFYLAPQADCITGVMVLLADSELPWHAVMPDTEYLLQISGECNVTELDGQDNVEKTHVLLPGNYLSLPKGTHHLHENPGEEESVTMFQAAGNIDDFIAKLRQNYEAIELLQAD